MCFAVQISLNKLSDKNSFEFKVIVLVIGSSDKGKLLNIFKNIALIFLPHYSPELKEAELIWHNVKRKMTIIIYKNMEEFGVMDKINGQNAPKPYYC